MTCVTFMQKKSWPCDKPGNADCFILFMGSFDVMRTHKTWQWVRYYLFLHACSKWRMKETLICVFGSPVHANLTVVNPPVWHGVLSVVNVNQWNTGLMLHHYFSGIWWAHIARSPNMYPSRMNVRRESCNLSRFIVWRRIHAGAP